MDGIILVLNSLWQIMWFPLINLSLDSPILAIPLVLLIFIFIFGTLLNIGRLF